MGENSHDQYAYMPKLAEQAERYKEKVEFMEKLTKASICGVQPPTFNSVLNACNHGGHGRIRGVVPSMAYYGICKEEEELQVGSEGKLAMLDLCYPDSDYEFKVSANYLRQKGYTPMTPAEIREMKRSCGIPYRMPASDDDTGELEVSGDYLIEK